jgi:site-specific DNA-methyltransferase (adenine-specific)
LGLVVAVARTTENNIAYTHRMTTFLKGDCLEIMKTLPSKSIDCFICDLPYGVLSGRAIGKTAEDKKCWSGLENGCEWDIKIDLKQFWTEVKRLAKSDNTPVIMFCTTKFGAELINSNPDWFRYDLVWSKSNAVGFLCANKMPMRSHEMMYVFAKKGAYYKRVDIKGDFPKGGGGRSKSSVYTALNALENIHSTKEGVRCVKSVIEIANKKGKGNHPTQKPAELYKWLLERYCPENGTMLDPTAGSYASCFVAKELGLKSIGIEKNPKYFWKAVAHLQF